MKTFRMVRREDATGISGTGVVAEGVEFANGACVLSWLTQFESLGIYPSLDELLRIHGHEGRTTVVFDETIDEAHERGALEERGLWFDY